jgi:hypothetical protein
MEKYNLDKLVKVECNDFYISRRYDYQNEIKFLGITISKEGIYDNLYHKYLGFDPPQYYTLKDKEIYNNPEVILHYQGNYSKTYYFDSYNEAKNFSDKITELGRWQD